MRDKGSFSEVGIAAIVAVCGTILCFAMLGLVVYSGDTSGARQLQPQPQVYPDIRSAAAD